MIGRPPSMPGGLLIAECHVPLTISCAFRTSPPPLDPGLGAVALTIMTWPSHTGGSWHIGHCAMSMCRPFTVEAGSSRKQSCAPPENVMLLTGLDAPPAVLVVGVV